MDGDLFFVSWNPLLHPVIENLPPLSYEKEPEIKSPHPVTINDMKLFFINFMKNDILGRVANAWVAFADANMEDPICEELSKIHSRAVDFAKTGVVAKMEPKHFPKKYPHYMEKPDDRSQHSNSVLGKMYDELRWLNQVPNVHMLKEYINAQQHAKLELHSYLTMDDDKYVVEAKHLYTEYAVELSKLMRQFKLKSEFQVITGFCLQYVGNKQHSEQEAIRSSISTIVEKFRTFFYETPEHERRLKACTWYQVTYSPLYANHRKRQFWSFAWILTPELLDIVEQEKTKLQIYAKYKYHE